MSQNTSFLALVAADLLRVSAGDLKRLTVVLPNRRSGLVLRKELARLIHNPVWTPAIYSVDDWVTELSGLQVADHLTTLSALYESFCIHAREEVPMRNFLEFSDYLLNDFEDIDRYLVNPEEVFAAISQFRSVDEYYAQNPDKEWVDRIKIFWASFGKKLSTHQEKWLGLWENLHLIYRDFHAALESRGLATSGMCYRRAAGRFHSDSLPEKVAGPVALVGFNILTKAEERIFIALKMRGKALFYWDFHPEYLDAPNEAGFFMRDNIERFPSPGEFQPYPPGPKESEVKDQKVLVYPMTSQTGMVKALVGQIDSDPEGSTLVVLSDESLLPDLGMLWRKEPGSINFTAGFPLERTQAGVFYKNLTVAGETQATAPFNNPLIAQSRRDFLRHPWSILLESIGIQPASCLTDMPRETITWLRSLMTMSQQIMDSCLKDQPLEKEAVRQVSGYLARLEKWAMEGGVELDPTVLRKLVHRFIKSTHIALETNRNAPVQVSGILETRLLDFPKVKILSFNEGLWPSKGLPSSMIPYSLRKHFLLPTSENRDAMYAYYFYRLIRRADEVSLFYLTGQMDEGIHSGEKSRYLTQIQFGSTQQIKQVLEPPLVLAGKNGPFRFEKNGILKEELLRYCEGDNSRRLSATALNDYLDCTFRFALRYLYGYKKKFQEDSPADPKGFGQLVHKTLEKIYSADSRRELLGKNGALADYLSHPEKLDPLIQEVVKEIKPDKASPINGKEQMAALVAREFALSVIRTDLHSDVRGILALENTYEAGFPASSGRQGPTVKIKAIIDRIDQVGERIRVVDYKTGNCDLDFDSIDELFSRNDPNRKREIFQVLLYCEILHAGRYPSQANEAALYRLVKLGSGDNETQVQLSGEPVAYAEIRDLFVSQLYSLLSELFDPEIPFVQVEEDALCRHCDFAGLCRRD